MIPGIREITFQGGPRDGTTYESRWIMWGGCIWIPGYPEGHAVYLVDEGEKTATFQEYQKVPLITEVPA